MSPTRPSVSRASAANRRAAVRDCAPREYRALKARTGRLMHFRIVKTTTSTFQQSGWKPMLFWPAVEKLKSFRRRAKWERPSR